MEKSLATRLELLQSATFKSERDIGRQRELIDALRSDGRATAEAEATLQRFETSRQGLLAKLAYLRQARTP